MGDRQVVVFDDFNLGDYGRLGEVHAPHGSYAGLNVQTYIDGSVGPRSGLVDLAPTGTVVGEVVAFGQNDSQQKVWYVQGTAARQFSSNDVAQAVATLTGALSVTPTTRVKSAEASDSTYISSYGDKSYQLDHATAALAALTGSPGGSTIAVYGERLMVGGSVAVGNRVHFSEAANFNSWPAPNYFDVGSGYLILLLCPQRQYLAIAKHDGSMWILSGVPGVSDYLRHVVRALPLGQSTRWGITADGTIWMAPYGAKSPATFNGSVLRSLDGVTISELDAGITDLGIVPVVGNTGLEKPADTLFVCGRTGNAAVDGQARLFCQGKWSRHKFGVNVSGYVDGNVGQHVFLCDGGAVASKPKFYAWNYVLDRPPFASQTFESLGDASDTPPDCSFSLPEWWAKDEHEVSVRAVIVDFKKWDHGFDHDNTFTVEVTPLRRYNAGDGDTVTFSFAEDPSEAATTGTRDRYKKNLGTMNGNGFRIAVTGIVGVAIQKIHVICDRRPVQGVA